MDKLIKDGIKVDMILTDPPYGTTKCKWDNIIPLNDMWDKINKIVRSDGAICLFGSEPFSSNLRMSNVEDIETRIFGGNIQWKYWKNKKWNNIEL